MAKRRRRTTNDDDDIIDMMISPKCHVRSNMKANSNKQDEDEQEPEEGNEDWRSFRAQFVCRSTYASGSFSLIEKGSIVMPTVGGGRYTWMS